LYFSLSSDFNDPFDAKLLPRDFVAEMKEMGLCDGPDFISEHNIYVKDRINGCGIFSMSRKCDDILMWSHYADSHKGMCIGFNYEITQYIDNYSPMWKVLVRYYGNHPFMNIYEDMRKGRSFNSPDDFMNFVGLGNALLDAALSVKHESWKYEDEVRIVSEDNGLHEFNPEAIDHVIFGINTPQSDQETIKNILKSSTWQHVRIFHAQRSKAALSLDIVDEEGNVHCGTVPMSPNGTTCHA
jgi:hypothetical protein